MRIVLHIGDGKCGSTSIQAALYAKRVQLFERGILYETGQSRRDHFLISTLLGSQTRSNEAKEKQQNYARRNLEQISKLASTVELIIISAESLFIADPFEVISLLNKYISVGNDISIVAYVRSPCSRYVSLMQQELRGSSQLLLPSNYIYPIDRYIGNWIDAVGIENIIVKPFDRARLSSEDVVVDFSNTVEKITGYKIDIEPTNQNVSISTEQLFILHELRCILPKHFENIFHRKSELLLRLFREINVSGMIGTPLRLTPNAAATVASGNSTSVANVNNMIANLHLEADLGKITLGRVFDWPPETVLTDIFMNFDVTLVDRLREALLRDPSHGIAKQLVKLRGAVGRDIEGDSRLSKHASDYLRASF